MTEYVIGQRVKFSEENIDPAKKRIIVPAKYGTVTSINRVGCINVRPDGEKFTVSMDAEELEPVGVHP